MDRVQRMAQESRLNKIFKNLFYVHLLLITILVIVLLVRGVVSRNFPLMGVYLPVLCSTILAAFIGFAWQAFTRLSPSRTIKAAFCLSPVLTCAFGILLVLKGGKWNLAFSVIAVASSVFQALYAYWARARIDRSNRILTACLAYRPPRVEGLVVISIVACALYSAFLMSGIAGATGTGTKIDVAFIVLILGCLAWTMQIVKSIVQVMVSEIKLSHFAYDVELDFSQAVNSARHSMGSVCVGSILVSVLGVLGALVRGIGVVFSSANWFDGVQARIVVHANSWGFVQVGVHYEGIMLSSTETWAKFKRVGMERLINSDLTSSFCFFCGVATGSICGLVGGIWAIVIQSTYATQVSIYTFFVVYFMTRVAMARVQASVAAYFYGYADNPQNERYNSTIPDIIQHYHEIEMIPNRAQVVPT